MHLIPGILAFGYSVCRLAAQKLRSDISNVALKLQHCCQTPFKIHILMDAFFCNFHPRIVSRDKTMV
jgi:hypothetical protein